MAKPGKGGVVSLSRKGDSQVQVSFAAISGATSYVLQFSRNGSAWKTIATLTKRSSLRTVTKDSRIRYRVAGRNKDGTGAFGGASAYFYSQPGGPTAIRVSPIAGGVSLEWTPSARYRYGIQVEESGRSTLYTYGTGTSGLTVRPLAIYSGYEPGKRYRVRAYAGPAGSRSYSPWSAWSDATRPLTDPSQATGLTPNGAFIADSVLPSFQWTANPTDGSAQTGAEIGWSVDGETWTVWGGPGQVENVYAPTSGEWDTVLGAVDSTGVVMWRVRTQSLSGAYGPWSAVATFTITESPSVDVLSPPPVGDGVYTSNIPNVVWAYGQAQGLPQSFWEAEIYSEEGSLLGQASGTGVQGIHLFNNVFLEDGSLYAVRVRAAAGNLWSAWAQNTFLVEFALPDVPTLTVAWDEGQGGVVVNLAPGPSSNTEVTEEMQLFRSTDGGNSWVAVTLRLAAGVHEIVDYQALSNGTTLYRAVAFSPLDAAAITTMPAVAASDSAWLAAGDTFDQPLRLVYDPERSWQGGRTRTTVQYRGSDRPVAYSGESLEDVYTVGGKLITDGEVDEVSSQMFVDLVNAPSPLVLWRDPEGHHFYASPSGAGMTRENHAITSFSLTLELVVPPEPVGETPDFVEGADWDDPALGEP